MLKRQFLSAFNLYLAPRFTWGFGLLNSNSLAFSDGFCWGSVFDIPSGIPAKPVLPALSETEGSTAEGFDIHPVSACLRV